jgi:transposase
MKQNKKKHYENEFKKRIVRLHLEEGRTLKSLAAEYNISHGSISNWIKIYREECQVNPQSKEEYAYSYGIFCRIGSYEYVP